MLLLDVTQTYFETCQLSSCRCRHSEGGFFNARLSFPKEYPQKPPVCRFTSDMWHPNGEW